MANDGNDDLAQRYRAWRKRTLGAVTERLEMAAVLEFLAPLEGRRILDAGCGDGGYAISATERGALATGADLSADMLAVARERRAARGVTVDWRQGDVMALPFPDASFDLAMAITLLCLVPDPRARSRISWLTRTCSRAGCGASPTIRPSGRPLACWRRWILSWPGSAPSAPLFSSSRA